MMNRILIFTVVLLMSACGSLKTKTAARGESLSQLPKTTGATEAESQDQLLLATLWYQKSAEMRALCYQCFTNAETALLKNLDAAQGYKTPAVVLDIDETVLDNSPFQGWQVLENRNFNDESWTRWVELGMAGALPGADSSHMLLKESTSSKVERRSRIESTHEILLLVGDNLADLNTVFEK